MFSPLLLRCDDPDASDAALRSDADAVVIDLGDGPSGRATRRGLAAEMMLAVSRRRPSGNGPFPSRTARPMTILRVASLASGLVDGDLDAAMAGGPDAVLLPGAAGARDLQHLAAKLAVREAERGLAPGRTRILAAPADTAEGVLALPALPGATPRLCAVVWDPVALAAALRVGTDASPVRAARDLLLIAAAAAGVPALDRGRADDDLVSACRTARHDGFAGRVARRAQEIGVIAKAFARA